MLQKIINLFFRSTLSHSDENVGWKLVFRDIPERFVGGWVEWDLTKTFKKFGLNIDAGVDYWTLGHVVDGVSSRFDPSAPEYQSWLGGYIAKLSTPEEWTVQDHFKLAIADQNSWLHTYGDQNPVTSLEGCDFIKVGTITAGSHTGDLYEGGCVTHSDVGHSPRSEKFLLETDLMADLFNLSNPKLSMKGDMLRPKASGQNYETLKLQGYIAIFNVGKGVKVVLYGNGAVINSGDREIDTFQTIKGDLLKAMQSCEIIKV
jgi:hypothetical protein